MYYSSGIIYPNLDLPVMAGYEKLDLKSVLNYNFIWNV